jgi:hypothetical protein
MRSIGHGMDLEFHVLQVLATVARIIGDPLSGPSPLTHGLQSDLLVTVILDIEEDYSILSAIIFQLLLFCTASLFYVFYCCVSMM